MTQTSDRIVGCDVLKRVDVVLLPALFLLTLLSCTASPTVQAGQECAERVDSVPLSHINALPLQDTAKVNSWLREHKLVGADLSGGTFQEADLSGLNLQGASLRSANLAGAVFHKTQLQGVDLSGANLTGADLNEADLSGALLREATLIGAQVSKVSLKNTDLSGANLSGSSIYDARFRGSVLSKAELSGSNIVASYFSGADLGEANLARVSCLLCYFNGVNLTGANLQGAYFRTHSNAFQFSSTDLTGANLKGMTIENEIAAGPRSKRFFYNVVWRDTVCMDGSMSEAHPNGCTSLVHLPTTHPSSSP